MTNKFSCFLTQKGRWLTATLVLLFTMGIGQMWATDTFVNLRTVDFTAMTKKIDFANGKNTISDAGYTDVEFYQKNTDKPLKLNNASGEGIDFSGQNIGNSHFVAIPLTGINGQLKVTVFHKYNSGKASFKLGLKTGTTTVTPGDYSTNAQTPKDGANADVSCSYTYGSDIIGTATTAVLFLGEAGTSYTQIKKVVIETLEAPSCSEPAAPTISGDASYTEGGTITLTASHDGANHSATTTYTWYKGGTWDAAKVTTPVQAAATGSSGYTFTKASCVTGDAGTYWCEAANSTCKSHNATGKTITVSESALPDVLAPTNLSSTAQTATSLTFNWTAAEHASSYDVYLYTDEGCLSLATPTESNPQNVTTTSATFTGLTVSTTYYCKVQSKGDGTSYKVNGGITPTAASAETPCTTISPTWVYPFTKIAVGITPSNPVDGNLGEGAVSYSSSATAAIDPSNSYWAKAAGSATITANVAAAGNYCAGNITSGTIAVVADQEGIITQTLTTGSNAWNASTPTTTDGTNITNLVALHAVGEGYTISGNGNGSNGGQTAKVPSVNATSFDDTKYLEMSFKVAAGKRLNVSAIYIPVQPVTSNAGKFKAVLSDGTTDIEGTVSNILNGKLDYIRFASFGTVQGDVTLRIYAWNWSQGYRLGRNVIIAGEVETVPVSSYDITYTTPSNGSYTIKVGESSAVSANTTANNGQTVTLAATPSSGYKLSAWDVYKTGESTTKVSVSNNTFTMPAYAVTVSATFEEVSCPTEGSGDVVFSWTPKSGSVSTEYIAAGGVDLAPYMESVVGGSITGYAQDINATTTTLYKNTNNHIYFNGDNAYIKVDLCELAEGDKFLVSGQANNMWVSTTTDRPTDAASAAAVLVPGEAFYVPSASALIGKSSIYIFREDDFTEVASLTITRPQKFTATYAAPDLTAGDVPAAVSNIFDGKKITLAEQGTMVKGELVFHGWNDGTQTYAAGADYTVGANVTLTAVWKKACPVSGEVYSFELTYTGATIDLAANEGKDLSDYGTVVGGDALFQNGSQTGKAYINYSDKPSLSFNGAAPYVRLALDCALQTGDTIKFVSGNGTNQICFTKTASRTTDNMTSENKWIVPAAFNGVDTIYIWRNSNHTFMRSLTITRPAPDASVPTIDASTPADASYAAADPISAMTVTADAEVPKALHYQWYKEAGETDIEVGTDAASYTPTASGEYYCVVTNSPSGYTPKSATSRTATITLISSDATLAWLKADGNDIALSDGVYAYEYTLPYNYAAEGAPTVTYATTDANATITNFTPAATKTGTATINVLAQDGVTSREYTVKFNEYSGCMDAFWFAEEADATANSLTNNTTFFSNMVGDGTGVSATFEVDGTEYTVTRGTSSSSSFGKLTIPAGFNANVYVALKTSGSNRTVTLVPTSGPSYTSANLASSGNHVAEFEDVAAGTYNINVSSGSNFVMVKAQICKYPMTGVTLPATGSVLVGQTVTLTPVFAPTNASNKNVTWESDAPSVATVANGVVTGVAAGTANITVTTVDGGFQATCAVTVSEMDCNTYTGNLFSFAVIAEENKQYTNVGTGNNEKVIGAEVATVESGAAYVGHTGESSTIDVANKQGGVWYFKFGDSNTYLRIDLACALKAGDLISLTSLSQSFYISTTATYPSNAANRIEIAANGKYMVQYGDILEGVDEIYVWRKSGSTYLKTLSIDRGTSIRNLTPGRMGTFTTAYDVKYFAGADFYVPNQIYSIGIEFIEVKELKAGYPYLIVANGDKLFVANEGDAVAEAEDDLQKTRGMVGYLGAGSVDVPNGEDYVVVKNNHLYTAYNNTMKAGYAYFDMTVIRNLTPMDANNSNGAPRRRLTVSYDAPAVTTDINNLEASEQPVKLMINGQIFILRGEKLYDATGRLVK